jgi:phosphoribosyl 1,2-cyclic phosphodiesterase
MLFHLNKKIALISDTRFFPKLLEAYTAEILIVNLLRSKPFEKNDAVDHLALDDFINIIDSIRPKIAIMTHFGMNIIKEKPYLIAEMIKRNKDIEVIAAYDGMKFEF